MSSVSNKSKSIHYSLSHQPIENIIPQKQQNFDEKNCDSRLPATHCFATWMNWFFPKETPIIQEYENKENRIGHRVGPIYIWFHVVIVDHSFVGLHDTFFEHFNTTDILANHELLIKSVQCDHLSDALFYLQQLAHACPDMPELVIVHSGIFNLFLLKLTPLVVSLQYNKNIYQNKDIKDLSSEPSEINFFLGKNSKPLI